MTNFFATAVLVCVAFTFARAQDPMKAEPTHYKLDFENERVQVVYVHYGPHEKSATHNHPQGVIMNITDSH